MDYLMREIERVLKIKWLSMVAETEDFPPVVEQKASFY